MSRKNAFMKFAAVVARIPYGPDDPANPGNNPPPPSPVSPPPPPVSPPPPPAPGPGVFSPEQQVRVNTLLAEERRKTQEKAAESNKATVAQLETMQTTLTLTTEQKEALQKQIDDLKATYTTKEQQAQTDMQKLQKKYDNDLKTEKDLSKSWQTRYENQTKKIELRAAAEHYEAVKVEQIEKQLWDLTTVQPKLDENGQPTDQYEPIVNWTGKDKEGKAVSLKLSPMDAVKAMVEDVENYGNLFRNPAQGGAGRQPPASGAGANGNLPNIEQMTPQQWMAHKAKLRVEMGKKV